MNSINSKVLTMLLLIFMFTFSAYFSNYLYNSELTNPYLNITWWNRDLFLINYELFGFVKKGLIGTFFNINQENLVFFSKTLSTLIIIFSIFVYSLIVIDKNLIKEKNYLILFGISPFLFSNIGYDFGRLDHFGIFFILLLTLLIIKKKNIFLLEIISPILILIHEIHFFTTIIFLSYIQFKINRPAFIKLYVLFLSFIILLILHFYGDLDQSLYNKYVNTYFFIKIYFQKTQIENALLWWIHLLDQRYTTIFYRHIFNIILYLFLCFFILKFSKNNFQNLLLISTYFLLFILGIDHSRFLSIFIINIVILFLILKFNVKNNINLPKFKNYYYLIIFLGPWGVGPCLPILTILKKFFLYGQLTFN